MAEIKSDTNRTVFILESAGRTATSWITEAVNRHSDIFMTHGIDITPVKFDRNINPNYNGTADTPLRSANDLHLDEYFDILEQRLDEPVIGSIHGYNGAVPYMDPSKYRRRYIIAAVTRHPIIRTESIFNQSMTLHVGPTSAVRDASIDRNRKFVMEVLKHDAECRNVLEVYKVDLDDPANMNFILSVYVIRNRDANNLHCGMPVYLMERLTSEIDNFCHLVHFISDGRVELNEAFITAVAAQPKRVSTATAPSGFQQYQSWQEWKREVFKLAMFYQNLRDAYENLGYDLSYVR